MVRYASLQAKTLKEALYATIHSGRYPISRLAEELDMAESYLYRVALPESEDLNDRRAQSGVRFPLKKLVPLTRFTRDFQILDVVEFQCGRVAVPIPTETEQQPKDMYEKALDAVVKFGDLMKAIHTAVEDDTITCDEQQRIDAEGREVMKAIAAMICIDK